MDKCLTISEPFYLIPLAMAADVFPIRVVSQRTGLPLDTLRAWERRYSAVVPEQGDRGRLYSEQQVQRLILLRDVVALGFSIGQIASESDQKLRAILKSGQKDTDRGTEDSLVDVITPVLHAIEKYDFAAADRALNRIAATIADPRILVHTVVLPLIREAGERWHQGTFRIAQEHMTTSLLTNLLASLTRVYTPGKTPAKVLLATPTNEQHSVALLAAAMLTAAGGLGVVYLGANLPAEEIVVAAKKAGCDAILLGLTVVNETDVQKDLTEIANKVDPRVRLWLAGSGVRQRRKQGDRWALLPDFHAFENKLLELGATY